MIIAFTGAGISKESGIDTFQDRPGIREKLHRTYARRHPEKFRAVMQEFVDTMVGKEPNDAHYALAEYKIPVITMNVDPLHELAGTTDLIKVHGRLPNPEEMAVCDKLEGVPVLYEDPAPKYQDAYNLIAGLTFGDILLVVGASTYTSFSSMIRKYVQFQGAQVYEIQDNAATKVREFLEKHSDKIEPLSKYLERLN